jgi:hypothetical protein
MVWGGGGEQEKPTINNLAFRREEMKERAKPEWKSRHYTEHVHVHVQKFTRINDQPLRVHQKAQRK